MECKEYHNLERKVSDIALRKFQLEILAEVWPLVMNMIIDGEIVQGEEFNIKAIYLKQLEKEMALFHKDGSRDDTPGNENSLENALSVIVISDQYFDNLQIAIESLLLLVDGGVKFKTSKKSMMIFDDDMQSQKMLESEVLLESRLVEPGNVKSRFGTTLKTPRGETKDLTSNISKEQAEIQALNQQTLDQLNQSDDKFSSPIEKRLISLEKSVNKLSDKGFNFEIKASERKQQKDFSFKADPNHKLTYELLEGSSKKIEQIKNMLVQKEVRDKLNTDNEMGEDVDDNQAIGLDVATRDNVISMLEEIENRINGYTTKLESTPQQAAKLGQNNNQGVPGNNLFSKQSNALGQNDGGGLFSNNTSININKGGLFGQGAGSMFNKQTANQDKYQQGNQKQNLSLLEQMSQQLYDVQNELKDLKIAADKNQKKYLESINDIGSQKLIRGDTATRQLKFDSESPINLHTPQQFDELKYSRIQQKEDFYSNIQEIIQTTVQTSLQRSLKQTNYRNIEARAPNADEQTNMPFDLGTLKYVIQQSLNRFSTNCLEQKFVLNRNNMKVDKKIKDINPIKFWLYKRLALPEKKEDAVVEADRASKEEGEGDEELSERDEISEFNKTLYTQLNNLLSQVVGSDVSRTNTPQIFLTKIACDYPQISQNCHGRDNYPDAEFQKFENDCLHDILLFHQVCDPS